MQRQTLFIAITSVSLITGACAQDDIVAPRPVPADEPPPATIVRPELTKESALASGIWNGDVEVDGRILHFHAALIEARGGITGGGRLTGSGYECLHEAVGSRKGTYVLLELECRGSVATQSIPDGPGGWTVLVEGHLDAEGRTFDAVFDGGGFRQSAARLRKVER